MHRMIASYCEAVHYSTKRRRTSAKRGSSVGRSIARRRGVWRQDQLRVVDDVADITVVADEADPAVRPLQPHHVAGLHRLRILPDRDYLAAIEPGGGEPHRGAARIDAEEHANLRAPG